MRPALVRESVHEGDTWSINSKLTGQCAMQFLTEDQHPATAQDDPCRHGAEGPLSLPMQHHSGLSPAHFGFFLILVLVLGTVARTLGLVAGQATHSLIERLPTQLTLFLRRVRLDPLLALRDC